MSRIVINSLDHLYLVNPDEIVLFIADDCYTYVFLANGERLVVSKTLGKFSEELKDEKFARVSQSHLVNISFIKSVDKKKKNIELLNLMSIRFTTSLKQLLYLIGIPH